MQIFHFPQTIQYYPKEQLPHKFCFYFKSTFLNFGWYGEFNCFGLSNRDAVKCFLEPLDGNKAIQILKEFQRLFYVYQGLPVQTI